MAINLSPIHQHLKDFEFKTLFNELGWSQPGNPWPAPHSVSGVSYQSREIAQLSGVAVLEITTGDGKIPDAATRKAIFRDISQHHHENLLIFLDNAEAAQRTQSLWYWVKREGSKLLPREHHYLKGQPGDLFLSKLSAMVVDIGQFDETGNVPVLSVAASLKKALDVEPVTKKFYADFKEEHDEFLKYIHGIEDERDRRWYASVVLNRLMFIYFLQRKGFLDTRTGSDGNRDYLKDKFDQSQQRGSNRYYSEFLKVLFFRGFAQPEDQRTPEERQLLGHIKYLNGGLFLPHPIEERWPNIEIEDVAFENLLRLFAAYSWNLDDTPGGQDDELNPDVLGYIFEKYINQKAFGAYYTRTEITEYLCETTIHRLILDQLNTPGVAGLIPKRQFDSIADLLFNLDASACRELLQDVLPRLSLLDPACGSGAFLVAAMKTLIDIYSAAIGKIPYLGDAALKQWLDGVRQEHPSEAYFIKKRIITDNLFGVDLMEEATEIAKLRLFLVLVASARSINELEPLPNIDFNIMAGNSLIGLMHVDDENFNKRHSQGNLFQQKQYSEVLAEKNRLIESYRGFTESGFEDLHALREKIQEKKGEALETLNAILLDEFVRLGIKFEEATWDEAKNKEGKPKKRALTVADMEELKPFHWGYEFDEILNRRGGFDAIITNPPWEVLQVNSKEFFAEYSDLVTKKKMTIKEFEEKQSELLLQPDVRGAWLEYLSRFPHQSQYFRTQQQFNKQISIVNGRKVGTDINLYKLFTEQCYNLLRHGGQCGIVIPSGIYTDLGAKRLREVLFEETTITGLFCFENRREIFENVHRSFKIVVLTFSKGGTTQEFPAAFMRLDVAELDRFPKEGALHISVDLIRRQSPDSFSVMEFKNEIDVQIAEKMLRFPLLGVKMDGVWNLKLSQEINMTSDSGLFKPFAPERLPLYEGKMIHHFDAQFSEPRYWVNENEARKSVLGREADTGQHLDYQDFRLGFRAIARNTDARTIIVGPIPKNRFCGNSVLVSVTPKSVSGLSASETVAAQAMLNSFTVDFLARQMVTANINMFYIYQLPVPRITEKDAQFRPIVERAARLICTTQEWSDLWHSVMNEKWSLTVAATNATECALLRAELDGLIAHLYGLTEDEFAYILSTFPIVAQSVKDAALDAYRAFEPEPNDEQLSALINKGETDWLEFKVAARWNSETRAKDGTMINNVLEGIAAYFNSKEGGALVIGVDKNGVVRGLADDYPAADPQKPNPDGYERFLRNKFRDTFGGDITADLLAVTFHRVNGHEVCHIKVQPSPRPVYLNGDLIVRDGNGKRKLNAQEAVSYLKTRWGM